MKRRKFNKNENSSQKVFESTRSTIVTMYGEVDVVKRRDDASIEGSIKKWKLANDSFAKIYLPAEKRLGPSKKFALVVGYNGQGYCGSQTNHNVPTVERDLERGLFDAGLISMYNFSNGSNLNKIKWSRAARTDKGVHALGNLFVMKLACIKNVDYPKLINKHLPESIRVLKCLRVTGGFSAKIACSDRSYEYLLPVSMLKRSRNPDLLAPVSNGWNTGARFDVGRRELFYRRALLSSKISMGLPEPISNHTALLSEQISRLRSVLKCFEGTHKFHNYTRALCGTDAQASRCIRSFTCSDPFEMKGTMYVRLCVKGQSFLYNQIRKMVGTALYVVRGILPMRFMEVSFTTHIKTTLPKAPAEGLLLRGCHYEYYNKTHGKIHGKIDMFDSENRQRTREFSEKIVYPTILSTLTPTFLRWMKDTDSQILESNLLRHWRDIEVRQIYFKDYFCPCGVKGDSGNKRPRESTKNRGVKRSRGASKNKRRRYQGKIIKRKNK